MLSPEHFCRDSHLAEGMVVKGNVCLCNEGRLKKKKKNYGEGIPP